MLLIMQKIRTTTQLLLFILLISWGGVFPTKLVYGK